MSWWGSLEAKVFFLQFVGMNGLSDLSGSKDGKELRDPVAAT